MSIEKNELNQSIENKVNADNGHQGNGENKVTTENKNNAENKTSHGHVSNGKEKNKKNNSKEKSKNNTSLVLSSKQKQILESLNAQETKTAQEGINADSLGSLKKLPEELLASVFGFLKLADGCKNGGLYSTNKYIRQIVNSDKFEWGDGLRLDLCLMMDLTGSMSGHLDVVKETLTTALATLESNKLVHKNESDSLLEKRQKFNIRASWIEYRDYNDNPHTRVRNFTSNIPLIQKYIDNTATSGGADAEDVAGGLWEANHTLHWTSNPHCRAIRVITLVLDTPPHGMGWDCDTYPNGSWDYVEEGDANPFPDADWLKIAYDFKRKNIIVNPILCVDNIDELNLFGATIAEITGGKCIYLNNAHNLGMHLAAQLCSDLELDEIITQQIKEAAETNLKNNGKELSEADLATQVMESISGTADITLPVSEGVQLVTHPKAQALSMCRSVDVARKLRILPDPTDQEMINRKKAMVGKVKLSNNESIEIEDTQGTLTQVGTTPGGTTQGISGNNSGNNNAQSYAGLSTCVSSAGSVYKAYIPKAAKLTACVSQAGAVSKSYMPTQNNYNTSVSSSGSVYKAYTPSSQLSQPLTRPQALPLSLQPSIIFSMAGQNQSQTQPGQTTGQASQGQSTGQALQGQTQNQQGTGLGLGNNVSNAPRFPMLLSTRPVNINPRSLQPAQLTASISDPGRASVRDAITGTALRERIHNKIRNQGRSGSGPAKK